MQSTIKQISELFTYELASIFENTELNQIVFMVLENILEVDRVKIHAYPEMELTTAQIKKVRAAINRLKKNEPIQYVLGVTEFYDLTFKVTPDVLIPRPETEELVHWIINDKPANDIKILDIGTGSGCIPIALKKNLPGSQVFATDISDKALKIAAENAKLNTCEISFFQSDILSVKSDNLPQNLDIICSNPPYVKQDEKQAMKPNVLDFEPHLALFVENNNPLLFYDRIAEIAKTLLKPNGTLYFEINEALGKDTEQLLLQKGYAQVTLKKDLYGKHRMIKAHA